MKQSYYSNLGFVHESLYTFVGSAKISDLTHLSPLEQALSFRLGGRLSSRAGTPARNCALIFVRAKETCERARAHGAARIPRDEITAAAAIYRSTGRSSIYLIMVNESPRGGGRTGTTATIWEKLLETRAASYTRCGSPCARYVYVRTYVPEAASIPIHFREADAHARKRRIRGERARASS